VHMRSAAKAIGPQAFLARLPLFHGLAPDELERLAAGTTRRLLARGEQLFREGEVPTGIHALVYGRIKLHARVPGGKDRVLDVVMPGSTFGEPVMFLGKPYFVTATALADSLALHVSKTTIFDELTRNPRFASHMIAALAQRVEALVREVQEYALGTATRRLVAWLLRRREVATAEHEAVVVLPAAKRVLASQLGLSAEHLSRVLHDLSARGLIAVRGRQVIVCDATALRAWHAAAEDARVP